MRRLTEFLDRQPAGRWLLLLGLVALSIRIAWASAMIHRTPVKDEAAYTLHAAELCAGQGFNNAMGRPSAFWPVGFPAILAVAYCAVGVSALTGIALQIAIGLAICLLVSLLGERVFGRSIGRFAGVVMALYPTHVFYGTLQLTEPIATLLVLASSALLVLGRPARTSMAAAAGALLGFAMLVRPVLVLLPALLPLWFIVNGAGMKRALRLGAVASIAAFIVISPWIVRNHRVLGSGVEISSSGGYNFFVGNHRGALGGGIAVTSPMAALRDGAGYDWSRGYRLGWEEIRARPLDAIRRAVQKTSYFFALETDGVIWNLKGLPSRAPAWATVTLLALANLAYVVVACGCLLGLFAPWPSRALPTWFLIVSGYLACMAIVFFGDPRYHFLLIPFAALMFSKAWLRDGPELRAGLARGEPVARRRLRRWMYSSAALGALIVLNLYLRYLETQVQFTRSGSFLGQ